MLSTVLSLEGQSTWDICALTRDSVHWPCERTLIDLLSVAETIVPSRWVDRGKQVITPSNVDSQRGGVRERATNYDGPGHHVSGLPRALSVGDALLPLRPYRPALLVHSRHMGAFVSDRFLALKPRSSEWGLWLWALFTSASGQQMREACALDAATPGATRRALMDLLIPALSESDRELLNQLRVIELTTHSPEVKAVETWWRSAFLESTDWSQELSTRNPLLKEAEMPLDEYCVSVQRGKKPEDATHLPPSELKTKYYRVADHSFLLGKQKFRWASSGVVVNPGTILLSAIGSRALAKIISEKMIIAENIYAVNVKDANTALSLARYLNSQEGFDRR